MLEYIIFALWFFLPAGVANVVPIFAAKLSPLQQFDAPMDFGKSWRGKRIFGAHKTWRGLIAGIIFATVALAMQQYLVRELGWFSHFSDRVDYTTLPTLVVGPLFAIGALGGDALESFFKRQFDIKPGDGWFPFDQTDYIIGGAIATLPFVNLSLLQYLWLLLIWVLIHIASTVIGYFFGLKDKPI